MNKNSYILIACEESGTVTHEFIELGYKNVFSADLQETSGLHPDRHVVGDVLQMLNGFCEVTTQDGKKHVIDDKFTMCIAFVPCTFMTNAGAMHLFKNGVLNEERYKKGLAGKEFFMKFWNADIKHIAIENPTPSSIFNLPPHTCVVQPYEHGHPYSKRTLLWLKNLPPIKPTNRVYEYTNTDNAEWFQKGGKDRQKNRSKFFQGIAKAMAQQWGKPFEYQYQPSLLDL